MRLFGSELTKREGIYFCLMLILAIGFFLNIYAFEKDLNEYREALKECKDNIYEHNRGYYDVYGRYTLNETIPINIGDLNETINK